MGGLYAVDRQLAGLDTALDSCMGDQTVLPPLIISPSSIDLVDTAFNYMDIEEESCRLKTVCEMEAYAVAHPLAKLAINTINSNLRGLDRYQDAIDAGMNGQDCAFLYDQCQFSYFGY